MGARRVTVTNAPGFDDFEATVIPGLGRIPARDGRGDLAVVADGDGEVFVVPADRLEDLEG